MFWQRKKDAKSANKKPRVFLIGGWIGWWNFGDIIQLKSVIKNYRRRVKKSEIYTIVPLAGLSSLEDLKRIDKMLQEVKLVIWGNPSESNNIHQKDFRKTFVKINTDCCRVIVLHLYGGGFLNEYGGKKAIEMVERAYNLFRPEKYLISGQQISKKVIKAFKKHVANFQPLIIGARDELTLKYLKENNINSVFSWDTSADLILEIKNRITRSNKPKKKTVGLHFNTSSHVLKKEDLGLLKDDIKKIFDFARNKEVILLNSFIMESALVKDTFKSVDYLFLQEFRTKYSALALVGDVCLKNADETIKMIEDYKIEAVFATSYHTALFFNLLDIPAYLFAFNDYYLQKHIGLYGRKISIGSFIKNRSRITQELKTKFEENIKRRREYLKKVPSLIKLPGKKAEIAEYTYQNWPNKSLQTFEIDPVISSLNDKVLCLKKIIEDKSKELQEQAVLLGSAKKYLAWKWRIITKKKGAGDKK